MVTTRTRKQIVVVAVAAAVTVAAGVLLLGRPTADPPGLAAAGERAGTPARRRARARTEQLAKLIRAARSLRPALDLPVSVPAGTVERALEQAADPVASLVPLLAGRSPDEELRTLRWMLRVPQKLVSAYPDLLNSPLTPDERDTLALERTHALIAYLEAEGARSPEMPSGLAAARLDPTARSLPLPERP